MPRRRRGGTAPERRGAIRHPKGDALSAHEMRGGVPHPEDAGGFCDCTAVLLLRLHRNCRSAGILFSVLPEKSMQKRGAGREIALTRRKTNRYILRIIVTLAVKERPSGDRRIGFPDRTINYMSRYVSAR